MICCRGICGRFEDVGFYARCSKDVKRCSVCKIAFKNIIQNRCPCCNQLMRTKPKQRKRYQQTIRELEIIRI